MWKTYITGMYVRVQCATSQEFQSVSLLYQIKVVICGKYEKKNNRNLTYLPEI